MEDRQPATESKPVSTHTTVNTTEASKGGVMVFILGGLVVAVLGIGYFVFSSGTFDGAGTPASGGDVSVTVETGTEGSGEAAPADAPTAPEAAETVPAETAPAD